MILIPSYVYAGSTTPTLETIADQLDEIDGKIDDLLDGNESFFSISITGLTVDNGAIGLFADCSDQFFSQPGNDCVFSIDSIRYVQTDFIEREVKTGPKGSTTQIKTLPGSVLGICIDFVNFASDKPISNCSPTLIDTAEMSSSLGLGFGPEISGSTGLGFEAELGIGIGPEFSWGISKPVKVPVQIPLPNLFKIGDKQVGGNILTDSELGGIIATKFVIIKHIDFVGDIHIAGVKGAKINLIVGKDTTSAPECNLGTVSKTCDSEFSQALIQTAGLKGPTQVNFNQKNAFGVTNVAQDLTGQTSPPQKVGFSNGLPSVGIADLLDNRADEIQELQDLRNNLLVDLIDFDDIDIILDKLAVKGLDQKIENLLLSEVDKIPGLLSTIIADVEGAIDLTSTITEIESTVKTIDGTVTDIEKDVLGFPTKLTGEVDRIIMKLTSLFS